MAIRIIEGVPGSGKTYFAVHHILDKYCEFVTSITEWKRKAEFKDLVIVSNLDGFPYALDLDDLISKAGSLETFFSYDYQVGLTAGRPFVYLIDEAQGFFPFTYRDTRVFLFFQKHRHLGMDIYLLTQDAEHLAKGMRSLAEFHIVAARRSFSVMGELRYRFVDPQTKECWMTKVLKKEGKYFSFYKSFSGLETEQIKSVPRRFAVAVVAMLLVILGGGYFAVWHQFGGRGSYGTRASASPGRIAGVEGLFGAAPVSAAGAAAAAPVPRAQPPVESLLVSVVGSFAFGSSRGFVVSVNGNSGRISVDDMVIVCKCHADVVSFGSAFSVGLGDAPATVRVLSQQARAVPQAPALPAVRANM